MTTPPDEAPEFPLPPNWAVPESEPDAGEGSDDSEAVGSIPIENVRSGIQILRTGKSPSAAESAMTIKGMPNHMHGLGRREVVPKNQLAAYPYSSICMIRTLWGELGTGFLIQGNRIVTAAHVIKSKGETELFFPNRTPIKVQGNRLVPHESHQADGDPYDFGVIEVDPFEIAGIAVLPFLPASNELIASCRCEVAGFPFDQRSMVRYPPHGKPCPPSQEELKLKGNLLIHSLDTTKGQSGSPIFARPLNDPGKIAVIGVHTGMDQNGQGTWRNRGVPVTTKWQ